MTESVQNHIGSLNWGYRVALREKKVVYENAYGKFIGPHRIKVIVKLHSLFFPGSFKTVFIGVSRKKKFLIWFLKKSKCPRQGHRDPDCPVQLLCCHSSGPSVGLVERRGPGPSLDLLLSL